MALEDNVTVIKALIDADKAVLARKDGLDKRVSAHSSQAPAK
jgi:hypothetical protein